MKVFSVLKVGTQNGAPALLCEQVDQGIFQPTTKTPDVQWLSCTINRFAQCVLSKCNSSDVSSVASPTASVKASERVVVPRMPRTTAFMVLADKKKSYIYRVDPSWNQSREVSGSCPPQRSGLVVEHLQWELQLQNNSTHTHTSLPHVVATYIKASIYPSTELLPTLQVFFPEHSRSPIAFLSGWPVVWRFAAFTSTPGLSEQAFHREIFMDFFSLGKLTLDFHVLQTL